MTDSDESLPEQVLATISGEISNCFRTAGRTHSTDLGSAAATMSVMFVEIRRAQQSEKRLV